MGSPILHGHVVLVVAAGARDAVSRDRGYVVAEDDPAKAVSLVDAAADETVSVLGRIPASTLQALCLERGRTLRL